MNSLEVLVIKNPAEQRRAPDTKRERREADRDRSVTPELLFGKVRDSVRHAVSAAQTNFVNRDYVIESIPRTLQATSGVFGCSGITALVLAECLRIG